MNILSNLKASLRNCYNLDNENFKKPEFCEDLSKYLNDFDNFCDFLIKESKGDGMISDEHVGKDSEASQGMGDFYE